MNGDRPIESIQSASERGMPENPMADVRKEAPAIMNAIMHDVRIAPYKLSRNPSQERPPDTKAIINAPTTPREAASVAVATPIYIDPMTATMSRTTGNNNRIL